VQKVLRPTWGYSFVRRKSVKQKTEGTVQNRKRRQHYCACIGRKNVDEDFERFGISKG
jgi:hypothetical protein